MRESTLVMIPGPTPVHEEILQAMSRVTYGHTQGEFVQLYRETVAGLKELLQADYAVAIGGSGTLAMEMALVNTVSVGEEILVLSNGYFGERFARLAEAYGIKADLLPASLGYAVTAEEVERKLRLKRYAAVTLTHVDTSTGVMAPVAEIAGVIREAGPLFILDGVCATGGIDEPMRAWGVDVLVTTSQKALGVPPGFAILGLSQRAVEHRRSLGRIPGYYTDLEKWLPIMDNPALYFSTPPVHLVLALHKGLQMVQQEGLAVRFARHERLAAAFRQEMEALGLEMFTVRSYLAPTLSVVKYPAGVDDATFRAAVEEKGVLVAGGVGPLKGKVFRVGHMGNIAEAEIAKTVSAIEAALRQLG